MVAFSHLELSVTKTSALPLSVSVLCPAIKRMFKSYTVSPGLGFLVLPLNHRVTLGKSLHQSECVLSSMQQDD